MHRKPRGYFVVTVVWLSFIFGELFSIRVMYDAFGEHPDRADWIISLFLGGPFIAFLLFVPVLMLSALIVGILFPHDY
jgi:hypothetical protein